MKHPYGRPRQVRKFMPRIRVFCAPCKRDGKPRQKMAEFDLLPEGSSASNFARPGQKLFTDGGPDGAKLHLMCSYGHERQILEKKIDAALAVVPPGGKWDIWL